MRAAPAVSRAKWVEKTHTSIQVQRRLSDIPCAMALRLTSRSPRRSGLFDTVASRNMANRPGRASAPPQDLTPTTEASGPHDFTVRFSSDVSTSRDRSRALKPALRSHRAPEAAASTASHPNVRDDGQRPFPGDRMA
jgi:hypothetical protein